MIDAQGNTDPLVSKINIYIYIFLIFQILAKMQEDLKVFYSDITRCDNHTQNNLYDLVKVTVAVPTVVNNNENEKYPNYYFEPKVDKYYVPKKKSRLKVKTVRDIRNSFEKDIFSYLPQELEKQQTFLLRKITAGSSRKYNTKTLAKNMLHGDKPISRSAWQMLTNLNPEGHTHHVQYVLWNGKPIRVNGSKGGKTKFLCNYDLNKREVCTRKEFKKPFVDSKKGLLRNSLTVKFKPGPLTKKVNLDDSYQKYNVGSVELVNLPKPGLEIQPAYGIAMEPRISNFLHNLRDVDGSISKTWAELATSVLGAVRNQEFVQNEESSVTFELKYKCDQNRLLMRRDVICNNNKISPDNDIHHIPNLSNEPIEVSLEIQNVVKKLLDTVEISLQQDNLYTGADDAREQIFSEGFKTDVNNAPVKEKIVKRKYGELDRLDVTVIRLPDAPQEEDITKCSNSFCTLGCVCASLQCVYKLKDHCGRAECMFQCTCDFSKFKITDSLQSNGPGLIPGLVNLNNKINLRLSKEEQKFHQTVVVTGEKSILLKSEKRNWKASKRYGEFYSNMSLKSDFKTQHILSIVEAKVNCENIEPWCMAHNLYKCFCKGKFTENSLSSKNLDETELNETTDRDDKQPNTDISTTGCSEKRSFKRTKSESSSNDRNAKRIFISDSSDMSKIEIISNYDEKKCARTTPYKGRKYVDSYYSATNYKIAELEKNDDTLRHRMLCLISADRIEDITKIQSNSKIEEPHETKKKKTDKNRHEQVKGNGKQPIAEDICTTVMENTENSYYMAKCNAQNVNKEQNDKHSSSSTQFETTSSSNLGGKFKKTKLKAWIEYSYKQYKQRLDSGLIKNTLEPPKHGKVALHPWSFILSRYRERKNVFMISKQGPYRIFMAVDPNNEFFVNCTNIDDIRFADLHKYPLTIKNLLTNAINDLKNDFCILCGLSHCWELVGSVSKVNDNETSQTESKTESKSFSDSVLVSDNETTEHNMDDSDKEAAPSAKTHDLQENLSRDSHGSFKNSKWFVMTVENDFSEIQFNKRGFFVKYESILKAINVARMSGKTVRLSAQKCPETNSLLQFGIYAIPDSSEHCVFVGPYDTDERLGIETVRTLTDLRNITNLTRGVWITTKADDNIKVIENPLAFIPSKDGSHETVIVSLPGGETVQNSTENFLVDASKSNISVQEKSNIPVNEKSNISVGEKSNIPKTVKPIKIRKTDGFYHLTSKDLIKQINTPPLLQANNPLLNNVLNKRELAVLAPLHLPSSSVVTLPSLQKKSTITSHDVCPANPPTLIENKKPVAEIAPQIKIAERYSETSATITPLKQPERGMFILKPEEINKRLMENKLNCTTPTYSIHTTEDIDQDIENFLATSAEYVPPNAEIFEISDDDECCSNDNVWKDVWIECKNIENLGLIKGRLNADNKLSFEFPGFKFTDFYAEEEAFTKINQ